MVHVVTSYNNYIIDTIRKLYILKTKRFLCKRLIFGSGIIIAKLTIDCSNTPTIVLEPLLIVFRSIPINNTSQLSDSTSYKIYLPLPLYKRLLCMFSIAHSNQLVSFCLQHTEIDAVQSSG